MKTDNRPIRPGEQVPRDHSVPTACFLALAIIAGIVILRAWS